MSVRAKWLASVGAFAVAGLVASIPVFIDRSSAPESQSARYDWLRQVPLAHGPALPDPSTVIGSAPDGQQLLATRIGPAEVCMRFGDSGRQCVEVDTSKQIQVVAKVRGPEQNALWGVLADDVSAVRVLRADGTAASQDARHGFGVLETPGKEVVSIAALDDDGRKVGGVAGDAPVEVTCVLTSCVTPDVS